MISRTHYSVRERDTRSRAAQLLANQPFLRGSLVLRYRTCGKSYCRCQRGQNIVGARQLVRRTGGRAAHFTVRNRCNLPRHAHQLAGAYGSSSGAGQFPCSNDVPRWDAGNHVAAISSREALEAHGLHRAGRDVPARHHVRRCGIDDVQTTRTREETGMGRGARPELLHGQRVEDPRRGRDRPRRRSATGPVDRGGSSRKLARSSAALRRPGRSRSLAIPPAQARLWFGRLEGGPYVEIDQGLSLPMLTPQRVLEALNLGEGLSESEWDPLLRAWVG